MDLQAQIAQIETKIRLLSSKLNDLRVENESLKEENERLKAAKAEQNAKIGVLTDKLEETQSALEQQGKGEPQAAEELRGQLNQYISELDDVIEWLQEN